MKKRDFIKTGLIGVVGLASLPSFAGKSLNLNVGGNTKDLVLPYNFDELEPLLDKETVRNHYHAHLNRYHAELRTVLSDEMISVKRPRILLKNASRYPGKVISKAGGLVNHKIYFKSLSPQGGGNPRGKIARLIERDFGSFDKFRSEFNKTAYANSGRSWTWLTIRKGKLKISTTVNNDNPLMDTLPASKQGHPLLCLDMWDHAYKSGKQDYIEGYWNLVNWDISNKRLANSKQV